MARALLLFALLLAGSPAFAVFDVEQMAQHPRWISLGQYQKSLWGGYRSQVRTRAFFLAETGQTDPLAELKETLRAFLLPLTENPDSHAQCRFPARLLWLKQVGAVDTKQLPQVECKEFRKFSFQNEVDGISLIFATGFLSNPASFFGHPLIKFNFPRARIPTSLLDISVNYGALTPEDENTLVYAMKGLFGGYDATFTNRQFYYNTHAYGEVDLRDMWEYQLNLTPHEVLDVVARTWEVMGQFFPYYFFSDNCASAVAQLIGDVTGTHLLPAYLPYALPYTVFDRLADAKRPDGTPLVKSVKLIPSRQTRLTSRFRALSKEQKQAVLSVTKVDSLTDAYRALPNPERTAVIETLFDYYSFRDVEDPAKTTHKDIKRELVADRLQLPAATARPIPAPQLQPPHEGQRPLLTRLSYFKSLEHGSGGEFHFRTSYYDFLGVDFGRPKNSSVRTADVALNFTDKKLWLRRAEFIAVETLNLSQTGLPGDGGYAWKFNLGFDSVNLQCRSCAVFKLDVALGKAFELLPKQVVAFLLESRVQSAAAGSGHLGLTPYVTAWIDPLSSGFWKAELYLGYRDYIDNRERGETIVRIENRLGLSRTWDIRAVYEKHVDERWSLGYSRYW